MRRFTIPTYACEVREALMSSYPDLYNNGAPCVVFSGAHRPYESRVVGMDGGAHQGIRAQYPREHRAPNQLQRYHICFIL